VSASIVDLFYGTHLLLCSITKVVVWQVHAKPWTCTTWIHSFLQHVRGHVLEGIQQVWNTGCCPYLHDFSSMLVAEPSESYGPHVLTIVFQTFGNSTWVPYNSIVCRVSSENLNHPCFVFWAWSIIVALQDYNSYTNIQIYYIRV
jgi:hypothetical protein